MFSTFAVNLQFIPNVKSYLAPPNITTLSTKPLSPYPKREKDLISSCGSSS